MEFIIHLAREAKDAADFNRLLDENEAEIPMALGQKLYNIVRTLDPPKKSTGTVNRLLMRVSIITGTWDDIIATENDERLNFPALSIKNTDVNNHAVLKIDVKQDVSGNTPLPYENVAG